LQVRQKLLILRGQKKTVLASPLFSALHVISPACGRQVRVIGLCRYFGASHVISFALFIGLLSIVRCLKNNINTNII
jgi:hypothetical protein